MNPRPQVSRRLIATLKILQRQHPAMLPVRLRRRRPPKCDYAWASCELMADEDDAPTHFEIVIDDRLVEPAATWALLHEYAHALSWRLPGPNNDSDHSAEWGLAHARVYSTWESIP